MPPPPARPARLPVGAGAGARRDPWHRRGGVDAQGRGRGWRTARPAAGSADFYRVVEDNGRWSLEWPPHLVARLPEGGTADPLDRRPIVLLPVLYTLWAAARACGTGSRPTWRGTRWSGWR